MSSPLRKSPSGERRIARIIAAFFAALGLIGFLIQGHAAWLISGLVLSLAFFASSCFGRDTSEEPNDAAG